MYVLSDAKGPVLAATSGAFFFNTKEGSVLSIIAITGMVVGALILASTVVRVVVKRAATKA